MEIRAAEISEILKKQIADFSAQADVAEVGQVLSVGDGVARVYGLDKVQAGEMVEFPGGVKGMLLTLSLIMLVLLFLVMTAILKKVILFAVLVKLFKFLLALSF